MTIRTLEDFQNWTPPSLVVYCWIAPTKKNGLVKPLLSRVGAAHDRAGAEKLIADDKAAMSNTYGGLFAPSDISHRHYRVFSAAWHKTSGF